MRIVALLVASVIGYATESYAQEKKHYHIAPVDAQKKVNLNVNAASVNCRINSTYNTHVVSVYGYPQSREFHPVSQTEIQDNIQQVTLDFEDGSSQDLSTNISTRVFGGFSEKSDPNTKPWYIYLSKSIPYDLSLNYGIGSSTVDLSGLAVESLKVNTGSAAVRIGYAANKPNEVSMDTFYTSVDMGVLQLDHLNLSRAKEVIADVGFGKLMMHFSDNLAEQSRIRASIGAGTLQVTFDAIDNPVIVEVPDSPLCRIKMPHNFRKIRANTFVNEFYQEDADNLLSFNIDVSVGNVEFITTGD
ncbi:MAG: hypothetical protein AAF992_09245 [Bacteroidota bacterium]